MIEARHLYKSFEDKEVLTDINAIFENGKTNLALADVGGELLMVSQFTLCADCRHGNRPSFSGAGPAAFAEEMFNYICGFAEQSVPTVKRGVFGADMQVELLNDGPFTIVLDSKEL